MFCDGTSAPHVSQTSMTRWPLLCLAAVVEVAAKEAAQIPEWLRQKHEFGFQSALSQGWAAFRWDSWAGYGIIFATVVTIASWILIGWLIYREAYGAVATPEPRTFEGAKWLREECPGHEVGTISEINLYPVKGAAQVSVQEAKVEATGFEGDRRCMCITASDNNSALVSSF